MKIDLTDTTSSKINSGLIEARRSIGAGAVGMVLTLVIVTDEGSAYDALKAAGEASREHPSRILAVISRPGRSPRARAEARLDAEIRVGSDAGTGETVLLRLHGELASQAQSVVLPLLLPDAPVVVWWPENAPENPSRDPLGALAQRRITDAVSAESPVAQLATRALTYSPGDTDLAWTRITPWRSMLAAALDQRHAEVESAVVEGESYNPSAELLGPGLTAVRLRTAGGDVTLERSDGLLAKLSMPDQPDRMVALKRRDTAELIAEELRRLDPDDIYATSVKYGVDRLHRSASGAESVDAPAVATAGAGAGKSGKAAAKAEAEEKAPKLPPAGPVASATRTKAVPKADGRKQGGA
jgi:glucose-6-phosphate dehydrogenase assembly protein OpcA